MTLHPIGHIPFCKVRNKSVWVGKLTMDRRYHKNRTNGRTKRAPLQGLHTYLYPCPLSCVSTNLISHISSCLLTGITALCIKGGPAPLRLYLVPGSRYRLISAHNLTAKKKGLDLQKCDPFYIRPAKSVDLYSYLAFFAHPLRAHIPIGLQQITWNR